MDISLFSSPERLEHRIAPAGLVTVSFINGLLTITGADGADHDIEIVKTGINTFRVDGNATGINDVSHTSKSFRGVLSGVRIEGGAGADTFELTNLPALSSLRFDGDAGVDSLSTTNLTTRIGGRVDIALGTESGSVAFTGNRTLLQGYLNLDLGGGGTAVFSSPTTTIDGIVKVTGGLGADSLSLTGASTVFRQKFTFDGGDGNDSFTASGKSLAMRGFVTMNGGAGSNSFTFGADVNSFGRATTTGLVDINLGTGPGTVAFMGNSTSILGALNITMGAGGGVAHLKSATVRNNVEVTGDVGNDTLEFEGRTSIARDLSFFGDTGDDVLTAVGALFSVRGATSMDGGSGASIFDLNVTALALAELTVRGGTSNDIVSIIADGTVAGTVNLQLGLDGTGPSSTILQSKAGLVNGLKFGGSLTVDMLGATVDVLTISNIQVAKAFIAQTGENVSTVNIAGLNGRSNVTLRTGAGADQVNIDNINAVNLFVDTETGADELRIERLAAFAGTSQVLGIARIMTGIGADQIRIGNSLDPANTKVVFKGAMTLDAGDGPNMRNDILGSNSFVSAPTIGATGGTLTQTEAI